MPAKSIHQNVTFIYGHDLDKTAAFYADVLGLEMVLDQGACRIFRLTPHSFIGVCCRPNRHVEPKGSVHSIVTDDVQGWFDHLKSKGADLVDEAPSYSEEFKVSGFFCRDPNGYMIEFQKFHSPEWPQPGA